MVWTIVSVLLLCAHQVFSSGVGKWDVFSTKTPYNWAHPDDLLHSFVDHGTDVMFQNESCNAVHISMVVRHGARYPGPDTTLHIADLQDKLLKFKGAGKFTELDTWVNPFNTDNANELVAVGQKELYDFGYRTGMRFNALFKSGAQNVQFISSSKTRAIDSSKFFYEGMKQLHKNIGDHGNEVNDALLRFYDGCENYENDVETNPGYFREVTKFEEDRDFANIKNAVKSRLGLNFTLASG